MFIRIVSEESNLIIVINIPDIVGIDLVHVKVELAIVAIADELERNL